MLQQNMIAQGREQTTRQSGKWKILILGHGRHGKDTVAEILNKDFGYSFISSSEAALDAIHPVLFAFYKALLGDDLKLWGSTETELKKRFFEERVNYRDLWKEAITLYNTPDKTALTRKILSQNDLYVGMRCNVEYASVKDLFDIVLWVDASERKPKESSMLIEYDPSSMILINNNGTEEDLKVLMDEMVTSGVF